MSAEFDAIVIGAGTNGLTAATTLAHSGRRVLLLERGPRTGGDARPVEFAPGFRAPPDALDGGWLPPRLARALGVAGLPRAYPEVPVQSLLPNGVALPLSHDPARTAESLRPHSARDAERWIPFTQRLRALTGFLEALYQLPPPDIEAGDFAELPGLLGLGRRFRALGRANMIEFLRLMPMSVRELLDDEFETDALKAAVASVATRDLRQGPASGGTGFVLLHHLVGSPNGAPGGRGYWRDRPDALVDALERTARGRGVAVRTEARVARILADDDAVRGVMLDSGEEIGAREVFSTADPATTLLKLVDPVWLDPEFLNAVRQIKFRGARSVALYALEPGWRPDPSVDRTGTWVLSDGLAGLERAADAAKYGRISDRLHLELACPSARWPGLAPEGKEVLVVHARWTPYALREGGSWNDAGRDALGRAVTARLAEQFPGFADRVIAQATLSPQDLEERYGITEGAATHGELTLDQISFMRPVPGWGRYAMPLEGLYLAGAGAHPGPGILGGPGWLAARAAGRSRRR